jgi:hypothetical protein
MKIMPSGDYYLWDCDWCDSRNRTLWTRIDEGKLVCGVCYASCHISATGHFADAPEEGPTWSIQGNLPMEAA